MERFNRNNNRQFNVGTSHGFSKPRTFINEQLRQKIDELHVELPGYQNSLALWCECNGYPLSKSHQADVNVLDISAMNASYALELLTHLACAEMDISFKLKVFLTALAELSIILNADQFKYREACLLYFSIQRDGRHKISKTDLDKVSRAVEPYTIAIAEKKEYQMLVEKNQRVDDIRVDDIQLAKALSISSFEQKKIDDERLRVLSRARERLMDCAIDKKLLSKNGLTQQEFDSLPIEALNTLLIDWDFKDRIFSIKNFFEASAETDIHHFSITADQFLGLSPIAMQALGDAWVKEMFVLVPTAFGKFSKASDGAIEALCDRRVQLLIKESGTILVDQILDLSSDDARTMIRSI